MTINEVTVLSDQRTLCATCQLLNNGHTASITIRVMPPLSNEIFCRLMSEFTKRGTAAGWAHIMVEVVDFCPVNGSMERIIFCLN